MSGMSLADATAHILATDNRFALGSARIRGLETTVFTNTPATLRELQQQGADLRQFDDYIVYQDERWSYTKFSAMSNRYSALLLKSGVVPGDRIAIAMRNYPEYLALILAIANVGAVAVLINAWWSTEELKYGFSDSEAKLAFTDPERDARIQPFTTELAIRTIVVRSQSAEPHNSLERLVGDVDIPHWRDSWPQICIDTDDDFAVMYSSGSTGRPKGVVLTHRGAISAIYSWMMSSLLPPLMAPADSPPATPAPAVILCATPLFHVTATHPNFLLSILIGATFVMMHKWDADEAVQLIRRESVTRFVGVPTMSADIADSATRQGLELPSLEYLGSGGAKRPAVQVAEQQNKFPHLAVGSGWGMTETNALGLGISGPDYIDKPEYAGRLVPPLQQLRVVDDDAQPVANGVVGELSVKSASLMRCYLNKPQATAEAVRDGWLLTGDLATIDDNGYVSIVGRKKDIIIRGGENISCLEVEGAIHRHDAVVEASVFSVPDDRLGEAVGTAIYLKTNHELALAELASFLTNNIASFKIPTHIWLIDKPLPRGATDKIDRRLLRKQCLANEYTKQEITA